jgi:hypothetical protein
MIRLILAGLSLWLAAADGKSLPEGRGRAETQRTCGKYHGLEMVTRERQSADQWSDTVDGMVGRGAEGTDDELELIMKYLAVKFGKDKSGTASTPVEQKIYITASAADIAAGLSLSKFDAEAITQYRTGKGEFKECPTCEKFRISM